MLDLFAFRRGTDSTATEKTNSAKLAMRMSPALWRVQTCDQLFTHCASSITKMMLPGSEARQKEQLGRFDLQHRTANSAGRTRPATAISRRVPFGNQITRPHWQNSVLLKPGDSAVRDLADQITRSTRLTEEHRAGADQRQHLNGAIWNRYIRFGRRRPPPTT